MVNLLAGLVAYSLQPKEPSLNLIDISAITDDRASFWITHDYDV